MVPTPAAEIDVDAALVTALLEEQHPDLASLPVQLVANGWDNAMFRIGTDLTARLPRRLLAVPLLLKERRWLPVVAHGLPLPVPVPLRSGEPGAGYPWPWAIGPWLPGEPAEVAPPADPSVAAEVLGRFVAALHRPAPADAPPNPFRGVPLSERDDRMREGLDRLGVAARPPSPAGPVARRPRRAGLAGAGPVAPRRPPSAQRARRRGPALGRDRLR